MNVGESSNKSNLNLGKKLYNNFSTIEHKKSSSISRHISSDVDSNSMYSFKMDPSKESRHSHISSKQRKDMNYNVKSTVDKITSKIRQSQGSLFRNSINVSSGLFNEKIQRKRSNCKPINIYINSPKSIVK